MLWHTDDPMRGERGDISNDGQGTRDPAEPMVWTVLLEPEFGVGNTPRWQAPVFAGAIAFGFILIAGFVAPAFGAWAGLPRDTATLVLFSSLVGFFALISLVQMGSQWIVWVRQRSPDRVQEWLDHRRNWLTEEQAIHERACWAVRSVWRPWRRPRWERLRDAARAFGLPAPRVLVIDPTKRFEDLPREVSPDLLEPEDVGHAATAAAARARLFTGSTALTLAVVAIVVLGRLAGGRSLPQGNVLIFLGILIVALLYNILRPASRGWIPGLGNTVVAAPSLVVVRSSRKTRVFSAQDSVLGLQREKRGLSDSRVTLTRDDGERVTLRFAGARDERLLALWTMWNHPRLSQWDDRAEEVVPGPDAGVGSAVKSV
ncbi:MAG: hypothetical protein ACTS27_04065 [Phycisphaerales bacterium]